MPRFSDSQVAQSNWFLGCTFSPTLMSGGISIGKCKRIGFILNGGFSKLAFTNWQNRNTETGNLLDTFRISNLHSTFELGNDPLSETNDKGLYRSYIRFGPMFRIFDFMYMYAAAGCGTYAEVKSYDGNLYAPTIHNGFEGEAGVMVKIKRFALSFGYTQNIDRDNQFSDYHLGMYYWMKVLQKRSNPQHRFIVGYRYSPSAPYGMSLGVAFGYYEKWGLIINGGFSNYTKYVWSRRNDETLYNPEGYYFEEIWTITPAQQSDLETYIDKGVFRLYYHIGPFIRLNDVFGYYFTLGYGNYAHVKKYPGYEHKTDYSQSVDMYATKIHNGVDGEIGIMLKFGRIGFTLGYQHNIGKYNLFQDINAGMQIWLGR